MASCSSLKIVDSNAAANAGAAALQALTISDAQVAQLCSQYMVESDGKNTILPADNSYTQRLNRIMVRARSASMLATLVVLVGFIYYVCSTFRSWGT